METNQSNLLRRDLESSEEIIGKPKRESGLKFILDQKERPGDVIKKDTVHEIGTLKLEWASESPRGFIKNMD